MGYFKASKGFKDMRKTFNNIKIQNWIEWFIGFCDADGNF